MAAGCVRVAGGTEWKPKHRPSPTMGASANCVCAPQQCSLGSAPPPLPPSPNQQAQARSLGIAAYPLPTAASQHAPVHLGDGGSGGGELQGEWCNKGRGMHRCACLAGQGAKPRCGQECGGACTGVGKVGPCLARLQLGRPLSGRACHGQCPITSLPPPYMAPPADHERALPGRQAEDVLAPAGPGLPACHHSCQRALTIIGRR